MRVGVVEWLEESTSHHSLSGVHTHRTGTCALVNGEIRMSEREGGGAYPKEIEKGDIHLRLLKKMEKDSNFPLSHLTQAQRGKQTTSERQGWRKESVW
jgi:hypothetical protein